MEAESLKIINARKASVGFAKAGWVWALRDLAPYVPSAARYAQVHGIRIGSRPLGSSTAAQASLNPAALIANRAWPTRTANVANAQRLQSLMRDALARAIDEEEDDMLVYMERKLQDRAREMQNSR